MSPHWRAYATWRTGRTPWAPSRPTHGYAWLHSQTALHRRRDSIRVRYGQHGAQSLVFRACAHVRRSRGVRAHVLDVFAYLLALRWSGGQAASAAAANMHHGA